MAPHAAAWDAEAIFPATLCARRVNSGFAAIYVADEDCGGSRSASRLDAMRIVFEELAAA